MNMWHMLTFTEHFNVLQLNGSGQSPLTNIYCSPPIWQTTDVSSYWRSQQCTWQRSNCVRFYISLSSGSSSPWNSIPITEPSWNFKIKVLTANLTYRIHSCNYAISIQYHRRHFTLITAPAILGLPCCGCPFKISPPDCMLRKNCL